EDERLRRLARRTGRAVDRGGKTRAQVGITYRIDRVRRSVWQQTPIRCDVYSGATEHGAEQRGHHGRARAVRYPPPPYALHPNTPPPFVPASTHHHGSRWCECDGPIIVSVKFCPRARSPRLLVWVRQRSRLTMEFVRRAQDSLRLTRDHFATLQLEKIITSKGI